MDKYFSSKKSLYRETAFHLFFEEKKSLRQIAMILPVCTGTIRRWCSTFASENDNVTMPRRIIGVVPNKKLPKDAEDFVSNETAELQAEVRRLRLELRREKLRADLNEEIINVAEGKFNISIRKKAGAKQ